MLSIQELEVSYGAFRAVKKATMEVKEGEFIALIGSNGAGKTTTVKAISGLLSPVAGQVEFGGRDITRMPCHGICEMGLFQVPEGRKLFPNMSVLDNLSLGAFLPRAAAREKANLAEVFRIFPRLAERQHQLASTLSGGEQQMVAIGRALMAEPRMLILDEPTLGLSPKLAAETLRTVKDLNERGLTVLVVCQEVQQVLRLAHRAYVMENGVTVMEGPATQIAANPEVRQAYLGL